MPRKLAVAALLFVSIALFSTASARQDMAPAQQPAPKPGQSAQRQPMPKPTNLQVLPKNIPVADLTATMRGFTKALGVECQFCHTRDPQTNKPNFASDANPDKGIARTMIVMTKEINSKYLSQVKDPDATPADKTVTCGTCHRGNSMPMPFAAAAGMGEHADHDHPGAPTPDKKPQ
jgi:hypothetical protein